MDFNRRLIELVKGYRHLYDETDALYGTLSREHAWIEIAGKLNVPESECKRAWVLLRRGYQRALKKQHAALRDPKKMARLTKWTYEDDLAFLSPYNMKQGTLNISPEYIQINLEEVPDALNQLNPNAAVQRKAKPNKTHESSSRTTCANQSYSNTLIKYILNKTTKRDGIQHFFDSMAATVQSFPPRDRALAKAKVFQVISQMEIEILGRENTPSVQNESPPVLYGVEQAGPVNNLIITPPPETPSPGILEPHHSTQHISQEPVIDFNIEPHEMVTIKYELESE